MVTLEQVDQLVGEMSEEDQRGLIARISHRLAGANGQRAGVSPEQFLRMCREEPALPQGATDSAATVRKMRDERAGGQ